MRALDPIDRQILEELRHDGRISWRVLGERVHLAPSSVAERVRRMEETRVISGYGARVDPAGLGRTIRAVVDCDLPPNVDPRLFEDLLRARPEVALAVYVTGPSDYTIVVDCAGPAGLDLFIRWLKTDAGVTRTESKFVLHPVVG